MPENFRDDQAVLTEKLYVIASKEESLKLAGALVFFATHREIFTTPPTMAISPDWRDTCGLLDQWADDLGVDKSDMQIPTGIGVWEMAFAFPASGSEAEIDDVAYRGMSQCVEDAIRHAQQAGSDVPRSPSGDVYYFSLISVPDVDAINE